MELAYPLYFLLSSYANDAQIYKLNIDNNKLSAEAKRYKQILGAKKKQITALDVDIATVAKVYASKTKTLTAIYNKKVNYRLKSATFYTIAKDLSKFDVKVNGLSTDNDIIYLSLVSADDRRFTEVIKYYFRNTL